MPERSGQVSELLQQWVKGDQEALGAVAPPITASDCICSSSKSKAIDQFD